jgi:hypothetical protein
MFSQAVEFSHSKVLLGFNQLPGSGFEYVFGRRNARLPGVEGDQLLEQRKIRYTHVVLYSERYRTACYKGLVEFPEA